MESFSEWIVDRTQFSGEMPHVAGMEPTVTRWPSSSASSPSTPATSSPPTRRTRGYRTVREVIEDPLIRSQGAAAPVEESGAA